MCLCPCPHTPVLRYISVFCLCGVRTPVTFWTFFLIVKTVWGSCIFNCTRSCQLKQRFWNHLVSSGVLLSVEFHTDNIKSLLSESPSSSWFALALYWGWFMIVVASERSISANSSVQLSGNGRGGREVSPF